MRLGESLRSHVREETIGVLIAGTVIVGAVAFDPNRGRPQIVDSSKTVAPLGTNVNRDKAHCNVFQVISSRPGIRTTAFVCGPQPHQGSRS